MPKTTEGSSIRGRSKATEGAPDESAQTQRIDAAVVRKIQNLADIIAKLESAGGGLSGQEEDHDEGERIKNRAIDALWEEIEALERAVYTSPVRPDDKASLAARAALLEFRIGEEWGDYKELDFGVERAAGKLLEGVLSFCRAD